MTNDRNPLSPLDRRESLRRILRWSGLALLGGCASLLTRRSWDNRCNRSGPCDACPQFSGCGLPKAKSAQQSAGQPVYSRPHHG